jgi:hypothetical protein
MPFGRQDGELNPHPLDGNQFQPTNQPTKETKSLAESHITHVDKKAFLATFQPVYNKVILKSNIL